MRECLYLAIIYAFIPWLSKNRIFKSFTNICGLIEYIFITWLFVQVNCRFMDIKVMIYSIDDIFESWRYPSLCIFLAMWANYWRSFYFLGHKIFVLMSYWIWVPKGRAFILFTSDWTFLLTWISIFTYRSNPYRTFWIALVVFHCLELVLHINYLLF